MKISNELFQYAVNIRRQIHQFPELGFDLDRTVAVVTKELERHGIDYTCGYGKGSVVAELGRGDRIIALRADMDALPIVENTDLPFKSLIDGCMHACGHDSHTAILLAVAVYLKEKEDKLPFRVRLIFQPSEECEESGARMLVENGVMDGVEKIIATHCDNEMKVGALGVCEGDYMAACIPLNVKFYGLTSHATLPQCGIDANAMAVEAYTELKKAVTENAEGRPYIWSVGRISGGSAHNIISDYCEMNITFRFYDPEFAKKTMSRSELICREIADKFGGRAELDWKVSAYAVHNDKKLAENFKKVCEGSRLTVEPLASRMSSEDFAWYLTKAPGFIFRYGTRNEEKGCTALAHRSDFMLDEDGMRYAIEGFCNYIMNGDNNG